MNAREMEKKWQKKWEEAKLFESEVDRKRKKFYITVAYPYPSGGMHIGHVRTYTVPDIVARFKRMQGFNVLFPMAWHVTGTPIIGAVNRLKEREPKQMYVLKEVFKVTDKELSGMMDPMGFAGHFIENHYKKGMKSLGYTIDWRRQFTTNDPHYNRFIEWQHGILFGKGLEKKGLHPVKWCTKDKNPVTTHDILEGENADIQEFTLIKFPLEDKPGEMLVAATLRPETIFGQTNMWVNTEVEYARARVGKEVWIISEQAVEKLSHQKHKIEVLGKVSGRDLIGKMVKAHGVRGSVPVLPSEFCDPAIGTGIVTSVPSDAPYDWIGLKDLQKKKELSKHLGLKWDTIRKIEVIPIIRTKEWGDTAALKICEEMGIKSQKETQKLEEATKKVYRAGFHTGVMNGNCGKYAGMKVEKAKDKVKAELIRRKKASTMLEFSEPVVSRSGGNVIVAKSESWFIDYANKKWKALAKKNLGLMKNVPGSSERDFEHTIDWLGEWPCVRNFGLGTPLPQDKRFIIEPLSDSTIYMAYYLIANRIREFDSTKLYPGFFEYVMLGKGSPKEVARKAGASENAVKELRESVEYWYPLDWRCSALELIPNHLTFMIFHHTAVFPQDMWPRGVAAWGMGLLEGGKMSSSKGNVILASDAIEEYGADTVRLFLFSSVEPWQDFDWRAREVRVARDRLAKWVKQVKRLSATGKESKELSIIDRWLLSETSQIVKNTTEALDNFETRKASLECFYRMGEAVRWYERRAREVNKAVMGEVLEKWVKMMTPFVPHACEELWESMGRKGFVSVAAWPESDQKAFDPRLERMEEVVRTTSEDIASILNLVKKKPKEIRIYVAPNWKHVLHNRIIGMASTPDKIIPTIMKGPEGKKYGNHALKFAQRLQQSVNHLREVLTEQEELDVLNDASAFMEKEFKSKVRIIRSYESESPKALRAEPGKPGIEVVS